MNKSGAGRIIHGSGSTVEGHTLYPCQGLHMQSAPEFLHRTDLTL